MILRAKWLVNKLHVPSNSVVQLSFSYEIWFLFYFVYLQNTFSKLLSPRPGGQYNIQCQHGTFNPEMEHNILPKDTSLYATILRSPVSHFKSAFNFFGAVNRMRKVLFYEIFVKLSNLFCPYFKTLISSIIGVPWPLGQLISHVF